MELQIAVEFDPQTETPLIVAAFRDRRRGYADDAAYDESGTERLYMRFARPTAPHPQEALEAAHEELEVLRRRAEEDADRAGELGRLELIEGCADRGLALGLDEAGLRAEFVRSRREHAALINQAQWLLRTPLLVAAAAIRDAPAHPFLYEQAEWREPFPDEYGGEWG
jgi:hypothetical protein